MFAEIIAIGTELTTGAKLDTNSQWLSVELAAVGVTTRYHQTMADDLPAMVRVFRTAADRSDLVIITGGLGPTQDDLTRHALAELINVGLECDEAALENIRAMFTRRKREMPASNNVQAMFPAGSRMLTNSRGTAPGIALDVPRDGRSQPCLMFALPGVPSEMKPMFRDHILPVLPAGGHIIRHSRINCFGGGESHIEELLGDITARGRDPEVGITAHEATITLRIRSEAATVAECHDKIACTEELIRERLGNLVFGRDDEELEDIVVQELARVGQRLATAESGTGGLLADRLTNVPGNEAVYAGGLIVRSAAAGENLLGLPATALTSEHAVSRETAGNMAHRCKEQFATDYAIAVTETTGVDNTDEVPRAWIALAHPEGVLPLEHILVGDGAIAKSRAVKAALNLLRLHLQRLDNAT